MADRETPNPTRARPSGSGLHWRVEGLDKQLAAIDRDMQTILGKLDLLNDLSSKIGEIRTLLDGLRADHQREAKRIERNDDRLDALENWRAATEEKIENLKKDAAAASHATAGKLVAGSATGGGLIYGIVEGLRAWLGG